MPASWRAALGQWRGIYLIYDTCRQAGYVGLGYGQDNILGRWVEYSRAKDEMFAHTDIKQAPWWVVTADDKRRARLNCIAHLLKQLPYQEVEREKVKIPPRQGKEGYVRPPLKDQNFVPGVY